MTKVFTFLFILLFSCTLSAQISENMILHGSWDDDELPTHTYGTFNEVWGYAADDREYAIMGSTSYIHFLDVTDPSNIVLIDQFDMETSTVWRDIKTYQNRAYVVSDQTNEGLTIFDLSDLPNSVTMLSQDNSLFGSSHNIFIDVPNGKLYVIGISNPNVIIYDLTQNPDEPVLLGSHSLPGGAYAHDAYVRDNIMYGSHETNGYYIWDFNDPTTAILLASAETNGYNHSSWLTEDGQYAFFAEEVPTGLPLGVVDLSNLFTTGEIEVPLYFKDPLLAPDFTDATPHNPFIRGSELFLSYYEDGVIVFDISDPLNPLRIAHYDTSPLNTDYNGYVGCWGMYPFLPSGNILASDMDNGLFVLEMEGDIFSAIDVNSNIESISLFPNPTQTDLTISLKTKTSTEIQYQILTVTGQIVGSETLQTNGALTKTIDVSDLVAGLYFVEIRDGESQITRKFVKR